MRRLRFMQAADAAVKTRPRIPVYLLRVQPRKDKEKRKVMLFTFSVKLDANNALLCDERIQRAYEDCETLEREIHRVVMRTEIENTDIECFDLPETKRAFFKLSNLTLAALMVERKDGVTYLYFSAEAKLSTPGLGAFALDRYETEMFCEFVASQFAMEAGA